MFLTSHAHQHWNMMPKITRSIMPPYLQNISNAILPTSPLEFATSRLFPALEMAHVW